VRLEKELREDLERIHAEVAAWPRWKRSFQPCPCLRPGVFDDNKYPVRDCPKCDGTGLYVPE